MLQSASVPVCSTVWVPSPSRPTQKLENVCWAVHVTAGCVHDADTLVNVPGWPAAAYPAQFWLVAAVAFAALPVPDEVPPGPLQPAEPPQPPEVPVPPPGPAMRPPGPPPNWLTADTAPRWLATRMARSVPGDLNETAATASATEVPAATSQRPLRIRLLVRSRRVVGASAPRILRCCTVKALSRPVRMRTVIVRPSSRDTPARRAAVRFP